MEHVFTDANFTSEVLGSSTPVLVDFWAEWCGPCRVMSPVVEALAGEFGPQVKVGKLNVDQNQETAQRFGVMSIPTFLVFKNGQVVDQIVGGMAKETLKERVLKHV